MKIKYCPKCKLTKDISLFNKNRSRKDGVYNYCRGCQKIEHKQYRIKNLHRFKEYAKRNKHNFSYWKHRSEIRTKYGLSVEQWEQIYKDQNGVCKICKKLNTNGRRLSVDHNHSTGKIRGLLCSSCNTAIGSFKENIEIMADAIKYLRAEGAISHFSKL